MDNQKKIKNTIFITSLFFILFYSVSIKTANAVDINFNIDKNFDAGARSKIPATLVKTTPNLYFYIEESWWNSQVLARQNEILTYLDVLSSEFDSKIYPTLTSVFGSEWKPGVDGDSKITILFHSMKDGAAGYFRSADEYIKLQEPSSNEKEMLYIALSHIDNPQLKVFLAHEFVHLITFNQKDRIQGVQEEIWFNEARADYASTILGYDKSFEGSNLQRRVKDFLQNPQDSLTEWQETKYDYAVVSLFMHYLADHYSISVLTDSLKLKSIGIKSINETLLKIGIKEDFGQIFVNWTIATTINNCLDDLKYCYLNQNLKNLRINPILNFLPVTGNSSLSVTNITKNWSGNWQKIIGGNGDLKLEFSSLTGLSFQVPYIVFDKNNNYSVNFLQLGENQKGEISIKDFGNKYNSLIIIPSLQTKISGFNGLEFTYPYSFKVSVTGATVEENQVLIQRLLDQIESLKKQIVAIQSGNNSLNNALCSKLNNNLYFGIINKSEVMCLQSFLKSQGVEIYPEALVTGNFAALTKSAVIRFQEKYKNEILTPLGLSKGTGFVGDLTRVKINRLLK